MLLQMSIWQAREQHPGNAQRTFDSFYVLVDRVLRQFRKQTAAAPPSTATWGWQAEIASGRALVLVLQPTFQAGYSIEDAKAGLPLYHDWAHLNACKQSQVKRLFNQQRAEQRRSTGRIHPSLSPTICTGYKLGSSIILALFLKRFCRIDTYWMLSKNSSAKPD